VNSRLGRALGPGSLRKVQRGSGSANWVLTWTDAQGRRRRQALSTDRRAAERIRAELIQSRDLEVAGLGSHAGADMLLADLRDAYLADLRTRATPMHVSNSEGLLARMLGALRAQRVRELRPLEVVQVRERLVATGLAPRTANVYVDRLRGMLNWASGLDMIPANPLAKLKRLPEGEAHQRYRRRALTDDEIRRFLDAAEADDRENEQRVTGEARAGSRRLMRHRGTRIPQLAYWRFLIETGCRYGETAKLTWSDVDLDAGVVTLRASTTKAHKTRRVPLRREVSDELVRLRELHEAALGRPVEPGEPVFRSPEGRALPWSTVNAMRLFDRLLLSAGIQRVDAAGRKLDILALRHTAASRFARAGVPLIQAQRILGHSDPKLTSRVYAHLDAEDLREAVELAGGTQKPPAPRLVRGENQHNEASA
jgi:integrase